MNNEYYWFIHHDAPDIAKLALNVFDQLLIAQKTNKAMFPLRFSLQNSVNTGK